MIHENLKKDSFEVKMFQMEPSNVRPYGAPRCAQREVKVRQDGPKRGPEPLGTPRGAQGSPRVPRLTPKGTQGEPKVNPRGSKGAKVDAQEGQHMKNMIVPNH